jgi:hypothetical protein
MSGLALRFVLTMKWEWDWCVTFEQKLQGPTQFTVCYFPSAIWQGTFQIKAGPWVGPGLIPHGAEPCGPMMHISHEWEISICCSLWERGTTCNGNAILPTLTDKVGKVRFCWEDQKSSKAVDFFFFKLLLGFKLRASCLLGSCSTTWANFFFFYKDPRDPWLKW